MPHIALISGSMKANGESTRIAAVLAEKLHAQDCTTDIIEAKHIPLWDESMWGQEGQTAKVWAPISEQLQKANAFIILAPEYNGTVPAALKNFFHCLSGKEAAHKPALLVSVSGGANGSYPIAELRATASKNNKLVFIPDHVIVRSASHVLRDDAPAEHKETHNYINARTDYSLDVLLQYTKAMANLSSINIPDFYKYGM